MICIFGNAYICLDILSKLKQSYAILCDSMRLDAAGSMPHRFPCVAEAPSCLLDGQQVSRDAGTMVLVSVIAGRICAGEHPSAGFCWLSLVLIEYLWAGGFLYASSVSLRC